MVLSGFLFLSWRIFEIVMLIPPMGMLAYFVHGFITNNQLTPDFILVLFIVVVLALAWAIFTTIDYVRARHDAAFVALVDLCFVGALIGGVVVLRGIATADCSDNRFSASSLWANLGPFGLVGYQEHNPYAADINKNCSLLKASFAFGIINILAFFVTFLLALLVYRNHRNDGQVVVKREYHDHRSNHRSYRDSRRSASRDYRRSRDYDYQRPRSSHRSSRHRSSSRANYHV